MAVGRRRTVGTMARCIRDAYADIQHALPLYGGGPANVLRDLLEEAGFVAIAIEPLMESALRGPRRDRERTR